MKNSCRADRRMTAPLIKADKATRPPPTTSGQPDLAGKEENTLQRIRPAARREAEPGVWPNGYQLGVAETQIEPLAASDSATDIDLPVLRDSPSGCRAANGS